MNMDRFRFRIYDTDLCKMFSHGAIAALSQIERGNSLPEPYILMQCTGLRDSEGKLVYEGDVVEIELDDYNNQVPNAEYDDVVTPKVKNICEVRYRLHGGFVALVRQPVRYKGNRLRLKNGRDKVLGNIYEGDTKNAKRD